ncbi:hypothetical protein RhiTH_009853 [Rhizoctonia solani]
MTETPALDPTETDHESCRATKLEPNVSGLVTNRCPLKFSKKKNVLNILLVGETGSGKTSFLSLLLNLLQGNGPFELKEQHDKSTESGLDTTQSQTDKPRPYLFTTDEGIQFQIIDTPGLADTRGIHEDKKHTDQIFRAVKEHVTRIDGVILVINGRNERLSASTKFTLETLARLFPRSIKENIGVMFTNVDDSLTSNFPMNALPTELQKSKCWFLENPLAKYKRYLVKIPELTESHKATSPQLQRLQEEYGHAVQVLCEWLEWLNDREAVPTTVIIEMYRKSNQIESRLHDTILSLENLPTLKKNLNGLIRDIEAVEKKEKSLTELRNKESQKTWKTVETTNYNTLCLSPGCHSNCHIKCDLELGDPESLGGWCTAFKTLRIPTGWIPFKNNTLVKCSKCSHRAADHRNYARAYEEQESEVYRNVIESLQDTQLDMERLKKARDQLQDEVEKVEKSIDEARCEIPRLVEEMNRVSLNPNYAGYIRSAIELFELHKKQLESGPDSDEGLSLVNKGISMFKDHLKLLKHSASNQIVLVKSKLLNLAGSPQVPEESPGIPAMDTVTGTPADLV